MAVINVTDDSFESEVINQGTAVLVEFWAEWDGPSKVMTPLISELANERAGQLKVVKVNVDTCSKIPQKYAIRGVPTFLIFKGGTVVTTKIGAVSKTSLTTWVDSNI